MEVSRLLEFYWQALLPSVNRLEKTLPRLYQTGEGSSKHSDSVIGSGSGIDASVVFWLAIFAIATYIKGRWGPQFASPLGVSNSRHLGGPRGGTPMTRVADPLAGVGCAIR